ncbi:hypothetical protein M9Y10_009797 [Tritrichomonas musculus]|uniref:Uncharacterized protein n=1 Tax=Tritrichomonas musculus TaxID=1915356 RepID=A0ABR2IQQ6_9EUKA
MERKFGNMNQNNENEEEDDEKQHPVLQIKKYDSRSQIFNDNDSFIAIEEQAMREDAEKDDEYNYELKMQELQDEIAQLKINLNEMLEEKNAALTELNLQKSKIEELNDTVQNLQNELKISQDKNIAINNQLSKQRDLNSELSLHLQELTEILNDKDSNIDKPETKFQPDQLISRLRALELQLASSQKENENLKNEIEKRQKDFIDEISRLTQEISNAHDSNSKSQIPYLPNNTDSSLLEDEIAQLRNQLDMASESQKTLSDGLNQQIETNSRLNTELSSTKKDLEKALMENTNSTSIINNLLEMMNLANPLDIIFNVRRLQGEKNEANTARKELCQLQISYDNEVIINEKLRKEISTLKDHILNGISEKENEKEKEVDEPTFDQNHILQLKSDYESRLNAERARTSSQKKKIDAIRRRDSQIAEIFSSVPEDDHTVMIQSLIAIFEALSANSDSISNSANDNIEPINDPLLKSAIEEAKGIALNLVPQDILVDRVDKMNLYQECLNEIFAKTIEFSKKFESLNRKIEIYTKKAKRQTQLHKQFQRFARPPASTSKFGNKSDVMINRNSNNNNFNSNANNDSTFNFNLNPNHSSLNLSRSPITNGSTPKTGLRRIPFTEKSNGVSPSTIRWQPREKPSREFDPPNDLF